MSHSQAITLIEQRRVPKLLRDLLIVFGASVLIALFAPISIRLPFSPVPLVMQVHVVLFLALLLGSKRAAAATLAFITYGVCGLPVFAGGGFGLAYLFGPTGGYLLGYVLAAYLTGALSERAPTSLLRTLGALFCGTTIIYLAGSLWLGVFVGGWTNALLLGVLPFLPGDALKTVLVLKAARKFSA